MRKIISSLCLLGVVALTLNSCKKGEVVQDVNSLGQGSYVTLVQKNNLIVDATNPAGSKVGVVAKEYGAKQEKVIVYTAKGTATQDRTKWKKVKEFPVGADGQYTIEVTGAEIAAAVGATLAPGDIYTMYNSCITTEGQAFDFGNTFPEIANNPDYNMVLTWQATVVCPFVPAAAAGTYTITTDPWDGAVGETAVVTANATSATVTYAFPYAIPPGVNPLVITVVPTTGAATVAKQTYGSYGTGFENFTAVGTGFFFSCTGFIDLSLTHTSGSGNAYGTYILRLKK
jgi:hypothetical protein